MAYCANIIFGRPSNKLVVIGVTGSNGKSTTVNLIAKILQSFGKKCGLISTINFDLGQGEKLNSLKMTMPSGWLLNLWLAEMLKNGCKYAVLEISSEGLAQNRHLGINFDLAVFTNLTPEHLESHGGFENYQKAKARLFQTLSRVPLTQAKKQTCPGLQKTIIANLDDKFGKYFLNFKAARHVTYGIKTADASYRSTNISYRPDGITFNLKSLTFNLCLKGRFDVYNSLAAVAAAASVGVNLEAARSALEKIPGIPGRLEIIQDKPFMLVVDYAPEPYALQALYKTLQGWPKNRLIHILGSCGGGRDRARRKILGERAGKEADMVIVTNEDPYDDDPWEIINEVAAGAENAGKILDQNLFKILDRGEAIAKAITLARPDDLVLITGKGAEQKMAVADGKYLDWDDRLVAREKLARIHNS